MRDYIRRLIIAGIMALCISLLFLGGRHTRAETLSIEEMTNDWIWPAEGVITDTYGTRQGSHKGIDIAGEGGTPVYAVDGGIVTKSYYSDSYGHVVFVKHPNSLETVYAHLRRRNVNEGRTIKQGEILGEMGSTGDSSGSHLHFEVHQDQWTLDKKNAINPVMALETVEHGESVQAMKKVEKSGVVLPAATKLPPQEKLSEVYNHGSSNRAEEQEKEPAKNNNSEKIVSITHKVQPGENLSLIAQQYHSSVSHIKEVNKMGNEKIYPNQQLVIHPTDLYKYIVQPGDTLELIAAKAGVSTRELMEVNNLTKDIIYPDQELFYRVR